MQSLPAWETQHFQGSYQEYGVGLGYRRGVGKTGNCMNIRRVSIRKSEERIQANTYILTFNQPSTPFCLERVEQYVAAPLGCFKCQKYRCHRKACSWTTHVCQMRWKRFWPRGERLLEINYMCKLSTRSSGLRKILRCLQNKKKKNRKYLR